MTEEQMMQALEEPYNEFADAELFLQEEILQLTTIGHAEFHVTDETSADWVMNRIKGWKREQEERKAAWVQHNNQLQKKIDWFEGRFKLELEDYALQVLNAQRGKKSKSFKLPCGAVLGYRMQPDGMDVKDPLAYQAWVLMRMPEAILDFVPKIDNAAVKAHAMTEGDVPDGAELTVGGDKFYLKV